MTICDGMYSQVAVAAFWAANSVPNLHSQRLIIATAASLVAGIVKEIGDHLKVRHIRVAYLLAKMHCLKFHQKCSMWGLLFFAAVARKILTQRPGSRLCRHSCGLVGDHRCASLSHRRAKCKTMGSENRHCLIWGILRSKYRTSTPILKELNTFCTDIATSAS